MGQHSIKIRITPDGKVETEVMGIKGTSCEGADAFLDSLGTVVEDKPTEEFYDVAGDTETVTW